jgi:hypothetical protein
MRFMDHLRLNPMCMDPAKPKGPQFDASFVTDATVFEIGDVASQMIDHTHELPLGEGREIVFTEIGQQMVKISDAGLDVSQYVGIVLPYEDCFFEFPVTWKTSRDPSIKIDFIDSDHGVHLHELSSEDKVKAGVSEYAHVVVIHAFARSILNGEPISVVHDEGWLAADEEGQLTKLNLRARVDKDQPSGQDDDGSSESMSTLVTLSADAVQQSPHQEHTFTRSSQESSATAI